MNRGIDQEIETETIAAERFACVPCVLSVSRTFFHKIKQEITGSPN